MNTKIRLVWDLMKRFPTPETDKENIKAWFDSQKAERNSRYKGIPPNTTLRDQLEPFNPQLPDPDAWIHDE